MNLRDKLAALTVVAGAWALLGAACFPLIDFGSLDDRDPPSSPLLTAAIVRPATERSVPAGAEVAIEWTMNNATGGDAIADVLVRDRGDLSETLIAGGLRIRGAGSMQTTSWDTTSFAGRRYGVIVRVRAGDEQVEATAEADITVNGPPSFEFTEPFEDVVLEEDPNDDTPSVTIRWSAFDPEGEGTFEIFADPDDDPDNANELSLTSGELRAAAEVDSFEWDGANADAPADEDQVYRLYAVIDDGVNPVETIENTARVTVPAPGETKPLEFTMPEDDVVFLVGDDPLLIEYTLGEPDDVLVDLGIDTDSNHRNGNEQVILFQRLLEEGTTEDSFEWDGTDRHGNDVADGIYEIYLAVNRGEGAAQIVDAGVLVFRRSDEDQPLIGLLAPASDETRNPGEGELLIRWRDDDPSGEAVIRITLDDDPNPDEAVETDEPEHEILADRDAGGDGVLDTFAYSPIEASLQPGRYYIFAYIDRDGAAPWDHVSVAPAELVIEDPDAD